MPLNDHTISSISATITATIPIKVRLPGVSMIHIDPSRCFHSYRPATKTRASLISVLIWIKSSSRYSPVPPVVTVSFTKDLDRGADFAP